MSNKIMFVLVWKHTDYGNVYSDYLAAFDTQEEVCLICNRFEKFISMKNECDINHTIAKKDYLKNNPFPHNTEILKDKTKNDFTTIEEWQTYCNLFLKQFGSENHKRKTEYDKNVDKHNSEIKAIRDNFVLKQFDTDFSDYEWERYTTWYNDFYARCGSSAYDNEVDYLEIQKF